MAEVFPRDILFYGGGVALARYGSLVARTQVPGRGGEDLIETVTRADAALCATAGDRDGVVRGYSAGRARDRTITRVHPRAAPRAAHRQQRGLPPHPRGHSHGARPPR